MIGWNAATTASSFARRTADPDPIGLLTFGIQPDLSGDIGQTFGRMDRQRTTHALGDDHANLLARVDREPQARGPARELDRPGARRTETTPSGLEAVTCERTSAPPSAAAGT
jgi:hypothetical protein